MPQTIKKIYAQWLTNNASDKHDAYDGSLNDCNDTCAIGRTTLCVSVGYLHSEHNMCTRSEDLVHNQKMVASEALRPTFQKLSVEWLRKVGAKAHMNPRHELEWLQISSKNLREALKLDACQNFGGCCSRYNTWWHTCRITTSLFWFIHSIGCWSFRKYWIIMQVNLAFLVTTWIEMVNLFTNQSNTIKFLARPQCFKIRKGS